MATEITSGYIMSSEQVNSHSKIYAGPGAGKTHFLVENIKNIVSNHPQIVDSNAKKVLCITYTNAAVGELQQRLEGYEDSVEIYTIHGFIIEHIIKSFQRELISLMKNDFGIEVSPKGLISSQIEGLGILHGIDKEEIFEYIKDSLGITTDIDNYSKKIMGEVEIDNTCYVKSLKAGKIERKFKASDKIQPSHIIPIKQYIWSKVRKLTHDEILYFGFRLLETYPAILYAVRVKFPFVFVDEFQDTNPLQTMIVQLLGAKKTVIGIVGDVAQSIYGFQGAHPSDFLTFNITGSHVLSEYVINGNRRSTNNIVSFCNYLRKSDSTIQQTSIREYSDDELKSACESIPVYFLIGNSETVQSMIQRVIESDGVVLTRTWAAAFTYIRGIAKGQEVILKKIYNSYYTTPIQIRDEIANHHNVTWVKAFKFIFMMYRSYLSGSLIDMLNAFELYMTVSPQKLTPKIIYLLRKLSSSVFSDIAEDNITCKIIEKLNATISEDEYSLVREFLSGDHFVVRVFDEQERSDLVSNVSSLRWDTSYKLFTEVFSDDSKYMTVHQAKGLEWDKVIVSVEPTRNDKTTLKQLYSDPQMIGESPDNEFTRIYYVACSRAKNELYIHIPKGIKSNELVEKINRNCEQLGLSFNYQVIE